MSRSLSIEELLGEARWLKHLAASLVHDPALADDLVQDTWASALKSPPSTAGSPRPWLARVVRNLASNARRSRGRREVREGLAREERVPPGPETLAQQAEVQRLLAEAVTRLDEPLRDAIVLRYFEGLDSIAAANRLGLPPSTLRTRLQRAIEALRADLDRRFEGERGVWAALVAPFARGLRSPAASSAAPPGLGWPAGLVAAGLALATVVVLGAQGPGERAESPASPGPNLAAIETPAEVAERLEAVEVPSRTAAEVSGREPARESTAERPPRAVELAPGVVAGTIRVDGHLPEWPLELRLEERPPPPLENGSIRRVPAPRTLQLAPEALGRFRFVGLMASWSGRLTVSPDVFADGSHSLDLEGPRSDLELALFAAPAATGRVVDRATRPVPGLSIASVVRGGPEEGTLEIETKGTILCRADGRFRIPLHEMPEGGWNQIEFRIRASEGYLQHVAGPFVVSQGMRSIELGDLVLEPVRTLAFRVVDPAGLPVEGAYVVHADPPKMSVSEVLEPDGRGSMPFVPDRAVELIFGASGYAERRVTTTPDASLEVVLEPLATLLVEWDHRAGDVLVVSSRQALFSWEGKPGGAAGALGRQLELGAANPFDCRFTEDGRREYSFHEENGPLVDVNPGVPLILELRDLDGRVWATDGLAVGRGEHAVVRFDVDRAPGPPRFVRKHKDPAER